MRGLISLFRGAWGTKNRPIKSERAVEHSVQASGTTPLATECLFIGEEMQAHVSFRYFQVFG